MFKRIKNLIELSKYKPNDKAEVVLNDEKSLLLLEKDEEVGDGKAVFLGEGTEEEYNDMVKEDQGMDKWYKRLKIL